MVSLSVVQCGTRPDKGNQCGSRSLSGTSVGDPDPYQNVTDPQLWLGQNSFGYTALKWAVLWFAYDMLPLEVGEESTRQLTGRHRGSWSSEETAPATSIYLFNMLRITQCWGSLTFWCRSGSADPFLWLMDPDPTPYFRMLGCQKNYFFKYFFLITYLQAHYLQS